MPCVRAPGPLAIDAFASTFMCCYMSAVCLFAPSAEAPHLRVAPFKANMYVMMVKSLIATRAESMTGSLGFNNGEVAIVLDAGRRGHSV